MTNEAVALTHRFDQALGYAVHVHGGQVRKGTMIPYVSHLMMVSALVLEHYGVAENRSPWCTFGTSSWELPQGGT